MLESTNCNFNLSEIYQYKLKKLFNSRTFPINSGELVFFNWDDDQQELLSLDIKGGEPLYLSWWCDLFDFEKIHEILCENSFNNYDVFFSFLRVLPSVFMINKNEYYENKNLFITYFISQLKSRLNFNNEFSEDEYKTELFNYLTYEIGLGDYFSKYFMIENGILLFNIEEGKFVDVKELIVTIHLLASKATSKKNVTYLNKTRDFQISAISFLLNIECENSIQYDDFYIKYTSSNIFMNYYVNNKEDVFSTLIGCLNENQSKCNSFVSDIIYHQGEPN